MSFVIFQKHLQNTVCKRGMYVRGRGRDVAMGTWGASRPLNIFKFARKLVQKLARQAARGLATVFSVTFF